MVYNEQRKATFKKIKSFRRTKHVFIFPDKLLDGHLFIDNTEFLTSLEETGGGVLLWSDIQWNKICWHSTFL